MLTANADLSVANVWHTIIHGELLQCMISLLNRASCLSLLICKQCSYGFFFLHCFALCFLDAASKKLNPFPQSWSLSGFQLGLTNVSAMIIV